MQSLNDTKIAIIGLGYVGLPLAVEFGKRYDTVGFDINTLRIGELRAGRDHTLEVDADARKYLAVKGYDPAMGARPMKRLIQEEVREPIADEILKEDSQIDGGGSVKISFKEAAKGEKEGKLTFEFNKKAKPEEKPVPAVAPGPAPSRPSA